MIWSEHMKETYKTLPYSLEEESKECKRLEDNFKKYAIQLGFSTGKEALEYLYIAATEMTNDDTKSNDEFAYHLGFAIVEATFNQAYLLATQFWPIIKTYYNQSKSDERTDKSDEKQKTDKEVLNNIDEYLNQLGFDAKDDWIYYCMLAGYGMIFLSCDQFAYHLSYCMAEGSLYEKYVICKTFPDLIRNNYYKLINGVYEKPHNAIKNVTKGG